MNKIVDIKSPDNLGREKSVSLGHQGEQITEIFADQELHQGMDGRLALVLDNAETVAELAYSLFVAVVSGAMTFEEARAYFATIDISTEEAKKQAPEVREGRYKAIISRIDTLFDDFSDEQEETMDAYGEDYGNAFREINDDMRDMKDRMMDIVVKAFAEGTLDDSDREFLEEIQTGAFEGKVVSMGGGWFSKKTRTIAASILVIFASNMGSAYTSQAGERSDSDHHYEERGMVDSYDGPDLYSDKYQGYSGDDGHQEAVSFFAPYLNDQRKINNEGFAGQEQAAQGIGETLLSADDFVGKKLEAWDNICAHCDEEVRLALQGDMSNDEKKAFLQAAVDSLVTDNPDIRLYSDGMLAKALAKEYFALKQEVTQAVDEMNEAVDALSADDQQFLLDAQSWVQENKDSLQGLVDEAQNLREAGKPVPSLLLSRDDGKPRLFYPRVTAGAEISARHIEVMGTQELNSVGGLSENLTFGVTAMKSRPIVTEKDSTTEEKTYAQNAEWFGKTAVTFRSLEGEDNPWNPQKRHFKGNDIVIDLQGGLIYRVGPKGNIGLAVSCGPMINVPLSQETWVVGPNGEKQDVVYDIVDGQQIVSHAPTQKKLSFGLGGEIGIHMRFEAGQRIKKYWSMALGLIGNTTLGGQKDNMYGWSREGTDERVRSLIPNKNKNLNMNGGCVINVVIPISTKKLRKSYGVGEAGPGD